MTNTNLNGHPDSGHAPAPLKARRRRPPRAPRLRTTNSLVILSSAVVFSVYAVGYSRTQPSQDFLREQLALLDAQSLGAAVAGVPSSPTPVPFRAAGQSGLSGAVSKPTPDPDLAPVPAATLVPGAATAGAAVAYHDGTYVGKGSGGHGSVEVTLIIQGGLIISVDISDCRTMYPCSKIKALPGRVIERQSAAVDWISGASDSSRGFRLAVLAALAQAKVS